MLLDSDEDTTGAGGSGETAAEELEVFVVEQIVDRRKRKGVAQYLVKREGWDDPSDMTWEPAESLASAR